MKGDLEHRGECSGVWQVLGARVIRCDSCGAVYPYNEERMELVLRDDYVRSLVGQLAGVGRALLKGK